jgi:hypothetical protein
MSWSCDASTFGRFARKTEGESVFVGTESRYRPPRPHLVAPHFLQNLWFALTFPLPPLAFLIPRGTMALRHDSRLSQICQHWSLGAVLSLTPPSADTMICIRRLRKSDAMRLESATTILS